MIRDILANFYVLDHLQRGLDTGHSPRSTDNLL